MSTTHTKKDIKRKKELYKVEIESFTLDNNENLKLEDKLALGGI